MNSVTGMITLIQHFSLHDGPGIRTTVFFKGCPLRCWWCHNPENINTEPEEMYYESTGLMSIAGREVSAESVVTEILKDKLFYDESAGGVTFSGGEPTMQFGFLKQLSGECIKQGVSTAIETNLFTAREKLKELEDLINLFICDLKLVNSEKHKKYTGVDNHIILDNLNYLYCRNTGFIVRIPLIGGVNDSEGDLHDYHMFFSRFQPRDNIKIEILPYHKFGESKYPALKMDYRNKNGEVSKDNIDLYVNTLKSLGFQVSINTW